MALNPLQVATLQNNYIFFACCRFVRSADLLHRNTGAQLEGSRSDLEPWGAAASPGRGERGPGRVSRAVATSSRPASTCAERGVK